jgi:hypothetical protein
LYDENCQSTDDGRKVLSDAQVDQVHLHKWQNLAQQLTFKVGLRSILKNTESISSLFYRRSLYAEHVETKGFSPSLKHRLFSGNEQYLGQLQPKDTTNLDTRELVAEIE